MNGIDPDDHGATEWSTDFDTIDHAHDLGDLARKAALE